MSYTLLRTFGCLGVVFSLLSLPGPACAQSQPGVVVNEIMYAPKAPEPEWIELLNSSDTAVNLVGWTFSVGTHSAQLPTSVLEAHAFVVLTKDTLLLRASRGDSLSGARYRMLQVALSALRNSGDTLVLRSKSGIVADSIAYVPAWGGANGSSLERRSYLRGGSIASNWATSRVGATPGTTNSVTPPDFDLAVDSISVGRTADQVELSVRLSNIGLRDITNAAVAVRVDTFTASFWSGALAADSSLRLLRTFGDSIAGEVVVWANALGDTSHANDTIRSNIAARLRAGDVVVSEIMAAPQKPEPEWIELHNTSSRAVDLGDWSLVIGKTRHPLPKPPTTLAANGYLILTGSDSLLRSARGGAYNSVEMPWSALPNSGGIVALYDATGFLLDSVRFPASNAGVSLERVDDLWSGLDSANWKDCSDSSGSTIGRPNSQEIARHHFAVVLQSWMQDSLYLQIENRGRDSLLEAELLLRKANGEESQIDINTDIQPHTSLGQTLSYPYTILGRGILRGWLQDDADSRERDTSLLVIEQPLPASSLVLNEIMFSPAVGSSEWVEIYNNTTLPVSLQGTALEVQHGSGASQLPLPLYVVEPHDYCVVAASAAIFNTYPALVNDSRVVTLGRSDLGLSNDSGTLRLLSFDSTTVDSARYSSHWTTVAFAEGVSLERRSAERSGEEISNWQWSSDANGATPLRPNSGGGTPSDPQSGFRVSIEPNPFSPNNDGFEDETTVTVETGTEDSYLARIRLFDRSGRAVATIADGAPLTGATSMRFTGTDNDGRRLLPGLYTALIELTRTSGTPQLLTKKLGVIVAGAGR